MHGFLIALEQSLNKALEHFTYEFLIKVNVLFFFMQNSCLTDSTF